MARALVVKGKAAAWVANVGQPRVKRVPRQRAGGLRRHGVRRLGIGGKQGVAGQQVQDVGEHQLLVLLLVLQAQLDQATQCSVVRHGGHPTCHAGVHVGPVGEHLVQRWPREQPALRAGVLGAHTVVVGVEQHPERRCKRLETGLVGFEHKGFKEPGGVGQVPLGGAGIGHGLRGAILGRQWGRQGQRAASHRGVARQQRVECGDVTVMNVTGQGRAWTTANQPRSSVHAWACAKPARASMSVNTGSGYL